MSAEQKLPNPISVAWEGLGEGEQPVVALRYRADDPDLLPLLAQTLKPMGTKDSTETI